ncbi:MAG TPA: NAD-glutamate dehydrogenase domain-containing protein, partial [Gammaproteobacteria bacterium]|nr:NAD-glutamate dehydrogenase domain-containing protein [Gammaproteobacteria bacterium]
MNGPRWKDELGQKLNQQYGDKKGALLYKKYHTAFNNLYCEQYTVLQALQDLSYLEKISADNFIELDFYLSSEKQESALHLRIYKWNNFIPLSDLLPILNDFDFRVFREITHLIQIDQDRVWISDFVISHSRGTELQFEKITPLFRDALVEICLGHFESDGFNKLILGANLSWREISIIRAYAKYLKQLDFRFSQLYIEQTAAKHASLMQDLIQLFYLWHDPKQKRDSKNQAAVVEKTILQALEQVTSLDEDVIIRRFLALFKATLRTNYFQKTASGQAKDYLSFKFLSEAIPELPLPKPLFEIFIYSPRFEGIHLRSAKVARGGLRWSDRREDYRTEVLGLMKAQRVKNAIIVPSGAKGGFVLKALPASASRELVQQEVVACYKLFISGLLDITDNIKEGKPLRPKEVVCLDEPDPYLVVAADKGTATFSDIANSLAKDYDFWLGDAFASGGATGYDHKKMGITARGAWESVKRHFRKLDINIETTVATVVGIGDMSGDVFGNGLIYSRRLKLIAAFDHRHIFLDPHPDPELSYQERLRLFSLPGSSWEDYNSRLLSLGGGVYKRSLKSISLSAEVKKVLAIQEDSLRPNELVRAILQAPVDLLWNGGIGTYVKSSMESNADVGDKTNDGNRVNGNELRCKVVGEGGNLGFTQRGRVEYALNHGLINTDFIDNSAGVDCSDHEVNLKILLNQEMAKGKLDEKKRNALLAELTAEVADLVLRDNYEQAWALDFLIQYSTRDTTLYQNYIKELEETGFLNRQVEFLPDDKIFTERRTAGIGLTTPELAVLLSYTKIYIKNEILKSTLPEEPFFAEIREEAFPPSINKRYHQESRDHILHREIVATQLSSRLVNEMGMVFVYRLQTETGMTVADVVRAHAVASAIFESQKLRQLIEALDFKIPVSSQYELLHHIRHLINISARWFLHEDRLKGDMNQLIEHYQSRIKKLKNLMLKLMTGLTKTFLANLIEQFSQA